MSVLARIAVVPLLAAAAFGCAQKEAPPDRFYRVESAATAQPAKADLRFNGTLLVERPQADGLLAGRPIVYAAADTGVELLEYSYDFWDKPPALTVQDELVRCMEQSGIAQRVVTAQARVNADYALTGRVLRFERIEATPPHAIVEVRLGVRDERQGNLLLWNTYAASKKAADDTMPATIAAFGAAVSDICGRLVADLDGS